MLKKLKASEAVGMVLGYDVTQVIPGKWKGPILKKGHRIRPEDVQVLLDTGNEYVWVIELKEGQLHEDEGAMRLGRLVAGRGLQVAEGGEGRVLIRAQHDGLLKVDRGLLREINLRQDLALSTLQDNTPVKAETVVAVAKIIPLLVDERVLKEVEEILRGRSVFSLKPYLKRRVGIVVTGSEVHSGRIPDASGEKVLPKLLQYGAEVLGKVVVPDLPEEIARQILAFVQRGADLVVTTGGLSVDPGDVTRRGVELTGAEVINYGSPIVPGTMLLYAVLGQVDILGLPACVYYNPRTAFDLILPRLMAGERPTREEIRDLGYGGLCLGCPECRFPLCPFGKA